MLLERGHELDRDNLARSIEMLKADQQPERGADRRGREGSQDRAAEDERARSATSTRCSENTITFAIGPAGTGQELPRGRARGAGAPGEAGEPHHPHPSRGRSRRAARVPARRRARQGRPVSAAALRRALRHGRARGDRPADGTGHDRGRAARVHARSHAERLVHHPRRGAEHDGRADEDVPHPARVRIEGRRHRRHHADRPARRARPIGPAGGAVRCSRTSTVSSSSSSAAATSCGTASCRTSSTPTNATRARNDVCDLCMSRGRGRERSLPVALAARRDSRLADARRSCEASSSTANARSRDPKGSD